jgi:hypothetical protein
MNTLSDVLTSAMRIAIEIDFIVVSVRSRTASRPKSPLCRCEKLGGPRHSASRVRWPTPPRRHGYARLAQ